MLSSDELAENGDILKSLHDQLRLTKYLAVVSCTLLLYDWVSTLDLEVEFIWGSRWSLGRFTYHTNRIWPIIVLGATLPEILFVPSSSPLICKKFTFLYAYGTIIQFSVISSMFLVRCWTLYGHQKLLWGLCLALAGSVVTSIALASLVLNNATYFANPLSSSIPGCPIFLPSGVWMIYIFPVIYEFLVFLLTFWKIWKMSREQNVTPLAQRLARNGTLYFALLLTVVIVACVGGATDSVDFAFSGSGIAGALSSVVCSRMALSLHVFSRSNRQERASASNNPEFVVEQNASIPLGCVSLKGGGLEP